MISTPTLRTLPDCPAQLFLDLYVEAGSWDPSFRFAAHEPHLYFIREANEALEQSVVADVLAMLARLLAPVAGSDLENAGRLLVVMRAIDQAFYRIHPRALRLAPSAAPPVHVPGWLRQLREKRRLTGAYAHNTELRLVPRGPLLRHARAEDAASADSLADRFASLGVVPRMLKQEARPIRVTHRVLASDVAKGIAPGVHPGAEVIGFFPIAEHATDLVMTQRNEGGKSFVEVHVPSQFNPATCLLKALQSNVSADIAIAPELVMSEKHADELPDALLALASDAPRVLIAGSGPTNATNPHGMAWNETCVLNSTGTVLWRQRKIWPAGLSQQRASLYGLCGTTGVMVAEDNASGDELVIIDVDTLGRCAVLICQDIQAAPMSADFVTRFQPDWIFTPILDPGIEVGRWVHQRAFELSENSRSRFVISSSTALAAKLQITGVGCGLAVGPKAADSDDQGRQYKVAHVHSGSSPGYAVATWGDGTWIQTTIK